MKRALLYSLLVTLLLTACGPVAVIRNDRPNRPHDNGKHKGWYKQKGWHKPKGWHKKGRYGGLPPGQAKKQRW
jgi:hypothetical protein